MKIAGLAVAVHLKNVLSYTVDLFIIVAPKLLEGSKD